MFIKYSSITNPQDWLQTIAQQLKVQVVNDEVLLPHNIGKGFFKQYYPFHWLTITYLKYKVHEPLEFLRKGVTNKPLIPIVFHLTKGQQLVGETLYDIGNTTANGIFMPSADISSKYLLPANQSVTNITLVFDKEWVMNEILEKDSYLYSLLKSGETFYIFEPFTVELFNLIQELEQELSKQSVNKLHFYSILMQILDKFVSRVNERKHLKIRSKLHSKDIDKLFEIRQILIDNICSPPSIEDLGKQVGMSKSKLQKNFKQIFGKSISQYTLYHKMKEAERMLTTQKYSIAEVGYTLGYSNLSHFSEIFKKHFNITPSAFLKSK